MKVIGGIDLEPQSLDWFDTSGDPDATMTGTDQRVSETFRIESGVSLLSFSAPWSGGSSPVGTFTLELSNDQTNWKSQAALVFTDNPNTGSSGFAWASASAVGAAYGRLRYTNASGTGTLSSASANGKIG